jgi:transketolase
VDDKFRAFGWTVRRVNGHDLAELENVLRARPEDKRPTLVIANTIKGRGVSFMEDVARWHHGVPCEQEFAGAMAELADAERSLVGSAL